MVILIQRARGQLLRERAKVETCPKEKDEEWGLNNPNMDS